MAQRETICDKDGKVVAIAHVQGKDPESCPQNDTGVCECGSKLTGNYGLGSGYGGIGSYECCFKCGKVYNYHEDQS